MSNRPLLAYLPLKPNYGDEVLLRAKLKSNAKRFSVNFCLPRPDHITDEQTPPFIAYHFRTDFYEDGNASVVHNWKNCTWQDSVEDQNYWMYDLNEKFTLIFRFHEECIKVFAEDTQHTPDYEFEHKFPMESIKIIELWDDLEYVEEIAFKYNHE